MARLGAGTRKRADGTLEKRFTIDGKRYSVYGKNAKEISQKEQEIRKKIEAGIYTDNRNITLDKYFDEWLAEKRGSIKGNTVKWYATYYKGHISPHLGNVKLQKMERRQVLAFQKDLSEGDLSIRTCNNIMKILKIVLNDAVTDEIIIKNPAEGVKALKEVNAKAAETYHRALTEQEQKDFMQEMTDDYYYEFVAFLLCTGMRFGEAAALTWSDIDYKQNVIHVTKTATFNEDNSRTTGTPKSESGKRDGKVKKKQTVICTVGYYDIVDWGGWIGDFITGGLKAKADILGLTEDALYELIYGKWQPIVDRVLAEFRQTEEYKIKSRRTVRTA